MALELEKPLIECLAQIDGCLGAATREGWLDTVTYLRDVRDLLAITIKQLAIKDSGEHVRLVAIGDKVIHGALEWLVDSIHLANENERWRAIATLQLCANPTTKLRMPVSQVARLKVVTT